MTAKELYRTGLDRLEKADIEDAGFDCLQLFAFATGMDRAKLLADGDSAISADCAETFWRQIDRRCNGDPLQYILGEWEFYSLTFKVGRGVLIPRADTEILVDEALRLIEDVKNPKVADLCAGSGCIAVSIGKNRPDAIVTAVELSEDATDYCSQNIALNGVNNVRLKKGDVLAGPAGLTELDLIVSNPPYIPTGDIEDLSPEVHKEPVMALDGGEDGLVFYRTIIEKWTDALNRNGMMAFEVGIHQAQAVAELLAVRFEQIYIVPDLNKVPRVVLGVGII